MLRYLLIEYCSQLGLMKSSPLAVKSFKIKWENPICGSEKIMINQKVKDNNKQARENYQRK